MGTVYRAAIGFGCMGTEIAKDVWRRNRDMDDEDDEKSTERYDFEEDLIALDNYEDKGDPTNVFVGELIYTSSWGKSVGSSNNANMDPEFLMRYVKDAEFVASFIEHWGVEPKMVLFMQLG